MEAVEDIAEVIVEVVVFGDIVEDEICSLLSTGVSLGTACSPAVK